MIHIWRSTPPKCCNIFEIDCSSKCCKNIFNILPDPYWPSQPHMANARHATSQTAASHLVCRCPCRHVEVQCMFTCVPCVRNPRAQRSARAAGAARWATTCQRRGVASSRAICGLLSAGAYSVAQRPVPMEATKERRTPPAAAAGQQQRAGQTPLEFLFTDRKTDSLLTAFCGLR